MRIGAWQKNWSKKKLEKDDVYTLVLWKSVWPLHYASPRRYHTKIGSELLLEWVYFKSFKYDSYMSHQIRAISSIVCCWTSFKAFQRVPGNSTLAVNLMARAWNFAAEFQTATTLGTANSVAQKWAHNLINTQCHLNFPHWEWKRSSSQHIKLFFVLKIIFLFKL